MQSLRISTGEALPRAGVALLAEGTFGATSAMVEREIHAVEREGTAWALAHGHLLRAGLYKATGRDRAAFDALVASEAALDTLGLELVVASAQRQRGVLTGGAEDKALVEAADERMSHRGVKNPARLAAVFAPGFVEKGPS